MAPNSIDAMRVFAEQGRTLDSGATCARSLRILYARVRPGSWRCFYDSSPSSGPGAQRYRGWQFSGAADAMTDAIAMRIGAPLLTQDTATTASSAGVAGAVGRYVKDHNRRVLRRIKHASRGVGAPSANGEPPMDPNSRPTRRTAITSDECEPQRVGWMDEGWMCRPPSHRDGIRSRRSYSAWRTRVAPMIRGLRQPIDSTCAVPDQDARPRVPRGRTRAANRRRSNDEPVIEPDTVLYIPTGSWAGHAGGSVGLRTHFVRFWRVRNRDAAADRSRS